MSILLAHRVNQQLLLWALCSPKGCAIVGGVLLADAAHLYNRHSLWGGAGMYDVEWRVCELFGRVFLTLPTTVLVSCIEGWWLRRTERLAICFLAMGYFSWLWYVHRFRAEAWLKPKHCEGIDCGGTWSLFLFGYRQVVIFLAHGCFYYVAGYPLAFIRPYFLTPPFANKASSVVHQGECKDGRSPGSSPRSACAATAVASDAHDPTRSSTIETYIEEWKLHAEPGVLRVQRVALLSTVLGKSLERQGLATGTLICLSLALVVLRMSTPSAKLVEISFPTAEPLPTGSDLTIVAVRDGWKLWLTNGTLAALLLILIAQRVNRGIFYEVLRTFEVGVLLVSFCTGHMAFLYNRYATLGGAGLYDISWKVADILQLCLFHLPFAILLSAIESWQIPMWSKVSTSGLALVFYTCIWVTERFFSKGWLVKEGCMWPLCPRATFLSAMAQMIFFLGLGLFEFLRGRAMAFYRPRYVKVADASRWGRTIGSFKERWILPASALHWEA